MKLLKLIAKSRNTEVNAVAGRISSAFHESSLEGDAILTPILVEIDAKNQELTIAVNRMKAESDLEAKDEVRDNSHHALYHFVFGSTFSATASTKDAANQLFTVLEHYGIGIVNDNYDTESSELDSLLLDLASPKLSAAIAALDGCGTLIADLQEAQDAFKAARLTFQEERAQEGQQLNATKLKQEVVALLNNKLIAVLNGLLISAEATYGEFAAVVNQIVETNNETVKKRKKEKPEPTESV